MIKRVILFITWAAIGAILSYGALYAFTPFGLAVVLPTVLVAWTLPTVGEGRLPEALGLLAGPGLFCFLVAGNAEDPSAWITAGAGFVGAAVIAYTFIGRVRCARGV